MAFEVTGIQGRVDGQMYGQTQWNSVKIGKIESPLLVYKLQDSAALQLKSPTGHLLELQGNSLVRLLTVPHSNGVSQNLHLEDLQGWLSVSIPPADSLKVGRLQIFCGDWVVESESKHLQLLMLYIADSSQLIIRVLKGQVYVAKRNEYGFTLDALKSWTSIHKNRGEFVDSTYAKQRLHQWIKKRPQQSNIQVVNKAKSHVNANWDMGVFLQQALISSDSNQAIDGYSVLIEVDRFVIQNRQTEWSVEVQASVTVQYADRPFANRKWSYVFQKSIINQQNNRLEFLALLPLNIENNRIQNSVFGELNTHWKQWYSKTILNPFTREIQ